MGSRFSAQGFSLLILCNSLELLNKKFKSVAGHEIDALSAEAEVERLYL